jgi:hypothetical protein
MDRPPPRLPPVRREEWDAFTRERFGQYAERDLAAFDELDRLEAEQFDPLRPPTAAGDPFVGMGVPAGPPPAASVAVAEPPPMPAPMPAPPAVPEWTPEPTPEVAPTEPAPLDSPVQSRGIQENAAPALETPLPEQGPADRALRRPDPTLVPDQLGDPTLSTEEAYSACGPAAAVAFARVNGRNPSLREALDMAKDHGWTAEGGMNGIANQKALMDAMGIPSRLETRPNASRIVEDAASGNPTIISTGLHYFVVDGWDPDTRRLHVGNSGRAVRGGSDWMTLDDMERISREAPRSARAWSNRTRSRCFCGRTASCW